MCRNAIYPAGNKEKTMKLYDFGMIVVGLGLLLAVTGIIVVY